VTSRKPDDIPAFNNAFLAELMAVSPGGTTEEEIASYIKAQ
jgi:hypothetical protein